MNTTVEFRLPDVGEGLTEAEIISWHVAVGDTVKTNDIVVEIETAKAQVELPAPTDGTVSAIHVAEGTTVETGSLLVTFAAEGESAPPAPPAADAVASVDDNAATQTCSAVASQGATAGADPAPQDSDADTPQVLVGSGPSAPVERRRRLNPPGLADTTNSEHAVNAAHAGRVSAKPPVRLLARQRGIDLQSLQPATGEPITRADVESASTRADAASVDTVGAVTRTPVQGVRKATAAAVTRSAFTAPHVTEWLTIDMTATMQLLARLKADRDWAEVRLTPLVFVARAFVLAIGHHPEINARWADDTQEIVQFPHINLGIAAATARGLIVPNIKNAEQLDLRGLAVAMSSLVDQARAGKTPPAQMTQGTVTITNIGALGVDGGTPILNPGESAILAFGAVRPMPWVVEGEVVARQVTQLAMSFDHRLVDGELGSRVLADVGRILSDPAWAIVLS